MDSSAYFSKFDKTTALEAVSKLRQITVSLCSSKDPSYFQFCAELKALLFLIEKQFETLADDEFPTENASSLLDELEMLCQYRSTGLSCTSRDTLDNRKRYQKHQPGDRRHIENYDAVSIEPTHHHPALAELRTSTESAYQAIKNFACNSSSLDRKKAIICLKVSLYSDLESGRAYPSPSNATLQDESEEPPPECGKEILSLHKTLSTYCFCSKEKPHLSVTACIRLSGVNRDESKVTFGLLFMDHPHHNNTAKTHPWWQDTEISLYRDVQTGSSKVGTRSGREIGLGSLSGKPKPFCHYITQQMAKSQMLLRFYVDKNQDFKASRTKDAVFKSLTAEKKLFVDGVETTVPRQWIVDAPSISLRRLLETVSPEDLTDKMKEVLSVFLAKAVWQHYSSPWMPEPWNKDSVHFILESRATRDGADTGIFVDEPLLSVSIPAPGPSTEETILGIETDMDDDDDDDFFSEATHRLPKLLGLGLMLIEIQLGRPIESLYENDKYSAIYCPNGLVHTNTNEKICKRLITMTPSIYTKMDTSDPLKDLITRCIFPNEAFMPPHVRSLEDDEIRQALYPLVNQLEIYNSKRQPHNLRPLNRPNATSSSRLPTPVQPPTTAQCLESPHEELRQGRTMAQITSSKTTEEWLRNTRCLIHILKPPIGEKYDKVKVAVLDTGVHPDHREADDIEEYRDFVSGNDSVMCDKTGHGTMSIRLVFDMCDSALVYALRIFDNDTATPHTQKLAIQALDWCMNNNIDIVCMACGFYRYDDGLREKVQDASRKMLIIAAPTNSGNRQEISYPARHDAFVVPMFATDGNVKNSGLNPSQGPGKHNFAILGEDIKDVRGEVKSGTSYAAAIATGFLARLLDFSRHNEMADLRKKAHGMKKLEKAKAVLYSMTTGTKDGPFYCIRPWDLLPSELRQQIPSSLSRPPDKQEIEKARKAVSWKIFNAIDQGLP